MSTQGQVSTPGSPVFEPIYSGKARVEGIGLKLDFLPWDIAEPQPALVAAEQAGAFSGTVLDAGCGLGEHAIYLASRGYQVTGVDNSPSAITQATERARAHGIDVTFVVADVTSLDGVPSGAFNTALEYGMYHGMTDEERGPLMAALHRVCAPGARLHMFMFTETTDARLPLAWKRVSLENMRTNFGRYWRIGDIEQTTSTTKLTREFLRQQRDSAPPGRVAFDPEALDVDDRGRILMPISHVHAERI
jgi:ubiquinone/menaquinone biosynthesis C-methylase UbiE